MNLNFSFLVNIFKLLDTNLRKKVIVLSFLYLISIFFDLVGISMVLPLIIILLEDKAELIEKLPFLENFILNYDKSEILIIAITAFLIFYLIKSLFLTFLTWYDKRFVNLSQVEFGEKLLLKYLSEDYLKFLKYNSSELIRNIIFESGMFVSNIVHNLINLFIEIILLIGISILLIYYEPIGSLLSIGFIFLITTLYIFFFKKKLNLLGKKRQLLDATLIKNLNQVFTLFKEVRLFDKSSYLVKKYKEFSLQRAHISIFEQLVSALPRVYFEFIGLLILTIIIYLFVFIKQDINAIIPVIGLYAAAMFRVIPSANRIIGSINSLNHNLPAFEVIYNDLKVIFKKSNDFDQNYKFEKFINKNIEIKSIEVKNLSFAFKKEIENKNKKILDDINLIIKPGQITGLIGRTGSGKSTFANIISGLIENYEGEYLINENLNFNKKILQKITGHVSQHVNLIDDTIINNICFGVSKNKIDFQKVNQLIQELNLEELINNLPQKLESNIGEQGLKLSGGQRQKISLARTLYLDPKIIIFDESTSSLDMKSENDFMEILHKIKINKIILFITHNKLLEKKFDSLYKLEDKKIIRLF